MALGARLGAQTAENINLQVAGIRWGLLEPGVLSVCAFALNPATTSPADGPSLLDPHIPLLFCDLPIAGEISIETLAEDKQRQAFLAFLSALWVLMRTPTVAQLAEGDIATGATRKLPVPEENAPRTYTVPGSRRVQVVQMLPMQHKEQEETGQTRTYRRSAYRWVVRGHWRNQAVGKNRKGRKLTWIASHLRGNPDGPLKTSEKVYAWRNS